MSVVPLFIPSPSEGVWHLGPLPIRAYALCIIAGIVAAVWIGQKRWEARGGRPGEVGDIAIWAVPFGLVGARVYHVCTDHDLYFGPGKDWVGVFEIWHGGLGIWGAIAGGALGAGLYCRRHQVRLRTLMDALAPALLAAQAIGRWGNYFNQELFGKPTTLPWGLEIDRQHALDAHVDLARAFPHGPPYTFHPTFLYECIWDLGAMGVVLWLDRRLKLGWGRCFALYVIIYCMGRAWIEDLRIDSVELYDVGGVRFNVWTSLVLFLGGLAYFVYAGRRHHRREESPYLTAERSEEGTPAGRPD
jgi:prolipoprotein diacylglyceryl transferase